MKGKVVFRNSQIMFVDKRLPGFTEGMAIVLRVEGRCVAATHTY
jgi:hypothetical protein